MRKISILLLLCTLVLCLAACGNQGTTDDDIVGDDWRTWGTIQDTGTLTHDGQMIDVCICITDTGADLYYDKAEQELYTTVQFPVPLDSAASRYQGTDYSDLDGDGICELLFAADPGSDDYRTCGWHGDTLEPIQFTGDARYGADPNGITGSLDGRVVFSGGIPMLEAWYYQLGTYCAVIGMNGTSDGVVTLDPSFKWNYRGSCYYLTVAKILPVYLDEGGTAVLTPGEKLLLTGTDGQNTFFRIDDGRTGSIRLEYDGEGGWTINGESEENFFEMLPYVG